MATTATDPRELYTTDEVAHLLRCSKASVYRAIADGRLAAFRLGPTGPLRIRAEALARFLEPAGKR